MIVLVLFFLGFSIHAADPRSVSNNRSGISALEKKAIAEAERDFIQALETEPEDARLHINLGIVFQVKKDFERAFKEYQTGLRFAKDPETKFFANFNSAQVIGSKDVDLALRLYQEALEYKPDSRETKHNIELLMQQQSGGGGGEGDKKNDKSDDKGEDTGQDRTQEQNKNEPQPYKGKELSQQDVQNILDELKNQEQKVRAKENNSGREKSLDKDW